MSYILNALRKSERDRQASRPGDITERISLAREPGKKRISVLLVALLISNVVLVGGIIWFFHRDTQNPVSPPAVKAADPSPLPVAKEHAAKAATGQPSISELMAAQKPAAGLKPVQDKPQETAKPLTVAPAKLPLESAKDVNSSETPENSEIPAAEAIAAPLHASAQPPLPPKPKPDIPFLGDLPADVRQNIPRVNINVFVYTQEPAERFVMIDMAKYVKGQQTPGGLEIRDIRPDSLVLGYQGRVFQLEAP